jgi:hypothetical protein
MPVHMRILLTFVFFAVSLAIAGPKKKDQLPAYVLKAPTAVVINDPNAGTSASSPFAKKKAQEDVEQALMKWGRLSVGLVRIVHFSAVRTGRTDRLRDQHSWQIYSGT